ncbi:hypothetical protein IFU08_12360 [Microbacterium sp. CFBP 8790]|uniref:hypothetical protein n=1 Tax=unclassified Microbacterium TaxID=2609290 RepID=UPI00177D0DEA|nr:MULTISPECIES: hypothetical protein [unclassified Microbacterium]MBD8207782.1 hypothetical protein [Microbacterium sp. CFBP 8801]MBD8510350.1 hypothetical protein [Microbacterium sp. CFBP 8790]
MSNSIERIHLVVDGIRHDLGPEKGMDDLEAQILEAIRSGGGFVRATLDRGQRLSIFVSSTSSIQIVALNVQPDHASADDDEQWPNFIDDVARPSDDS